MRIGVVFRKDDQDRQPPNGSKVWLAHVEPDCFSELLDPVLSLIVTFRQLPDRQRMMSCQQPFNLVMSTELVLGNFVIFSKDRLHNENIPNEVERDLSTLFTAAIYFAFKFRITNSHA